MATSFRVALKNEGHGFSRAAQAATAAGLRVCVRTPFSNSVPQGRLNLAQDASPGLDLRARPSPVGTAENKPRRNPGQPSAVAAGLNHVS
jgi:hypothetical protein